MGLGTLQAVCALMSLPPSKAVESSGSDAATLHRSYTRVTDALRNSMGEAGRAALLARAFACTEQAHPALKELHVLGDDGVRADDIAASIGTHAKAEVAAAIEALIGGVLDILSRLVGADMAMQLTGDGAPRPQPQGGDRATLHPPLIPSSEMSRRACPAWTPCSGAGSASIRSTSWPARLELARPRWSSRSSSPMPRTSAAHCTSPCSASRRSRCCGT